MICRLAQKELACSNRLWAVGLACISTSFFWGCKAKEPASVNADVENQSSMEDYRTLVGDGLSKRDWSGCGQKTNGKTPVLYAHFLEQTLNDKICFEDVLTNISGALNCAPGPFLFEQENAVDVNEKQWELKAMPDYFVWHLDNRELIDESFFITNQSGFPIRSQTLKLQNDKDSTVVLLPKTALTPGVNYYIYLVLTTKDARQTWIQPIAAAAASQANPG